MVCTHLGKARKIVGCPLCKYLEFTHTCVRILLFKLSSKSGLKFGRERDTLFRRSLVQEEEEEKCLPSSGMKRDLSVTLTFRSSVAAAELLWIFGW